MAGIRLGNLSIGQIEREYGFEFTDSERERLRETHHPIAEVTHIPTGEDITRLLAIEKTVKVWNRRA